MYSLRKTFFHIFVLAGLALSPLYDVLSKEPNFFLAHNSDPNDFIMLIGMVSFVFPLVIAAGVTLLLYCFSIYKILAVRIFVALFASLVLLPFVKGVMDESVNGAFFATGFLGIAFSFVYGKFAGPQLFLNYISPAILIFPALFLFEPKIFVLAVPEPSHNVNYPMVSVPSDAPVVFIMFDEFPLSVLLDRNLIIDKEAFPNFYRLAGQSHWFRNASAEYAWTAHSVSSTLRGVKHDPRFIGTYRNYPENLFTLLGNDYQVDGYESTVRLCPPHICLENQEGQDMRRIELFWKDMAAVYLNIVIPQPESFGVPGVSHSYKEFWNRKREIGPQALPNLVKKQFNIPLLEPYFEEIFFEGRDDLFNKFLSKMDSESKKKFYFLHILFPHGPYRYLSSGTKYDLEGKFDKIGLNEVSPIEISWEDNEWLVKFQRQKFMHQVGYTDHLLGQLLDRLEKNKNFDSTLFVLAADHGVNFQAGGFRRQLRPETLENIVSVPLFIKLPGQKKGEVSDLPATLLDILPTLGDVLDIKIPWAMAGHSLFQFPFNRTGRVIHNLYMQKYAVPDDLNGYLLNGVDKKYELFGKFEGWDKFRLQDERSQIFMDEPVSKFKLLSMEDVRIELDLGSRVETGPGFLPAIVQGQITGIDNMDEWVALISVNEVFRAVSPIVKIKEQEKILAFLPEIAFKEGSNEIGVYLIRKPFAEGGEIFKPLLN